MFDVTRTIEMSPSQLVEQKAPDLVVYLSKKKKRKTRIVEMCNSVRWYYSCVEYHHRNQVPVDSIYYVNGILDNENCKMEEQGVKVYLCIMWDCMDDGLPAFIFVLAFLIEAYKHAAVVFPTRLHGKQSAITSGVDLGVHLVLEHLLRNNSSLF